MIIRLSEAKARLSKIVDLVPHKPKGKRKLGRMRDTFSLPDDFLDESHEINEMFYGNSHFQAKTHSR